MKPLLTVALENVMKIGQTPSSPPAGGNVGLPKPGQGTSPVVATGIPATSKGVPVTVSSLAQSVRSAASADADIDTNKVESVRSAISNGTYKVNAEAIADKLLSNAKEVFKHQQH
jgi:negative regulator of flagellin synthesis FlgM